jgi:heat shock protein beta
VFKDPRGDTLGRGTRVTLKLKEDSKDFLLETKIKKILQKYSEFVNYPIYLRVKKDVSREVPMTEEELSELE